MPSVVVSNKEQYPWGTELLNDPNRKAMEAFLRATAAARELTDAINTARLFGIVLAVGAGEAVIACNPAPEFFVYVADGDEAMPPDETKLRIVK